MGKDREWMKSMIHHKKQMYLHQLAYLSNSGCVSKSKNTFAKLLSVIYRSMRMKYIAHKVNQLENDVRRCI